MVAFSRPRCSDNGGGALRGCSLRLTEYFRRSSSARRSAVDVCCGTAAGRPPPGKARTRRRSQQSRGRQLLRSSELAHPLPVTAVRRVSRSSDASTTKRRFLRWPRRIKIARPGTSNVRGDSSADRSGSRLESSALMFGVHASAEAAARGALLPTQFSGQPLLRV